MKALRIQGIHTFPGKFKISVEANEYGISSFVAGTHRFETESKLERHVNSLEKHLKIRGMSGCKITITQL